MNDFSTVTAFRLVRRLAIGQTSVSMYLMICEESDRLAVEADLMAELEIQLGIVLRIVRVSEFADSEHGLGIAEPGSIRAVEIDRWSPEILARLDTHVVRIERTGAQYVFITTPDLAERLLTEAPNFRNRLTDVLHMIPDAAVEGGSH